MGPLATPGPPPPSKSSDPSPTTSNARDHYQHLLPRSINSNHNNPCENYSHNRTCLSPCRAERHDPCHSAGVPQARKSARRRQDRALGAAAGAWEPKQAYLSSQLKRATVHNMQPQEASLRLAAWRGGIFGWGLLGRRPSPGSRGVPPAPGPLLGKRCLSDILPAQGTPNGACRSCAIYGVGLYRAHVAVTCTRRFSGTCRARAVHSPPSSTTLPSAEHAGCEFPGTA